MSNMSLPADAGLVPRGLAVAAAWGWRLIVLGVLAGAILWTLAQLPMLVVALALALLVTVLLGPIVRVARRHRWPPMLASLLVVLGFVAAALAAVTLVVRTVSDGLTGSLGRLQEGWSRAVGWLDSGPLHVHAAQLDALGAQAQQWLSAHAGDLTQGVWTLGASAAELIAGTLVFLLATVLLLADGHRIWWQFALLLPAGSRRTTNRAARAGWQALGAYVHTQSVIASIDGAAIALGAAILVPQFALAFGLLVFVTAFIPVLGIIIAGAVCVLVTLLVKGWVAAAILGALVLGVHELEVHLLQPWLMGHAVAVHPLAVIIVVAAATMLAGVAGALFAVPLLAFANAAIRVLAGRPADRRAIGRARRRGRRG